MGPNVRIADRRKDVRVAEQQTRERLGGLENWSRRSIEHEQGYRRAKFGDRRTIGWVVECFVQCNTGRKKIAWKMPNAPEAP